MTGILIASVAAAFVLGFGALVAWGTSGPPTRPRPRSPYRGPTFMDVDRKLRRGRRR